MSLVLDSSATLAWVYGDETTQPIRDLFERVSETGAVVPNLWRLEVSNSLLMGIRRGRVTIDYRDAVLEQLSQLDIKTDGDTDTYAWSTTVALAQRFGLTTYDAAYLELANRRTLPLATLDKDLRSAATELGVRLLGQVNGREQ